eukprot:7760196-Pyramimonas_sp.AAC.1
MGIAALRKAAKAFPARTAVGAETWRPTHWALVSDGALSFLRYLFYLCECWSSWPGYLRHVHVILLQKPSGGYRPIALLVSLYRVWAKARIDHVRSWANRLGRPFLALGPGGRATTDVASRVLLHGEAHPPQKKGTDGRRDLCARHR